MIKLCPCGKKVYCEKNQINRKKYCSKVCMYKYRPSLKDIPRSKEVRKKISIAHQGKVLSLETKKKIGDFWRGKKKSELEKLKNKISQVKRWDKVGRKEYRRYIHLSGTYEYKSWRTRVFVRDDFKCRICDVGGYLEAHHILKWSEYPELRYNINNGITLCRAHHPRKRAEEKRLIPTFMELVSVSSEQQF